MKYIETKIPTWYKLNNVVAKDVVLLIIEKISTHDYSRDIIIHMTQNWKW